MNFIALIISGYLLGSVPFGLIIAKAHGVNLRDIGSGNIGATNVSRALGKKWAYFCFFLDVMKGLIPTFVGVRFISTPAAVGELFFVLGAGFAAVLGHIFPLYVRFKGGKGVATSFGVALGLWPYYTICSAVAFFVWVIVVLSTKYISLGSVVAAISFPVILGLSIAIYPGWDFANLWPLLTAAILIALLVVVRHRENIGRLMAGTENKVLKGKAKA